MTHEKEYHERRLLLVKLCFYLYPHPRTQRNDIGDVSLIIDYFFDSEPSFEKEKWKYGVLKILYTFFDFKQLLT